MQAQITPREERNQKLGIRISVITHLALLFLAFWFLLPSPLDKEEKIDNDAVVIQIDFRESSLSKYAHADPGKKRPKSVEVKKMKPAPMKPVEVKTPPVKLPKKTPVIEPKVSEPVVSEILEEESIIEAIEEDIEIEEPELEEIVEPEPEPVIEEVIEEVDEAVIEEMEVEAPSQVDIPSDSGSDSSEAEGEADTAPSIFDGEEDGTGKGSAGTGDGMDGDSGNDGDSGTGDGGAGTGEYDGSGDGIFGRKVIERDIKGLMGVINKSGKIVIKTCINRRGMVTNVQIMDDETTITNRTTLKKALKAIRNYKFEQRLDGPMEECGKLTISQDLSSINKFN